MTPNELRILVVDDEADVREAVSTLLETFLENPRVRQASSAGEGLSVLRREGADLILTDFKMPGMNGIEFLDAALKLVPGTPHIVVTAFDREAMQSLGPGAGSTPLVHKPFDPTHLLSVVDRALTGSSTAA